MLARMAAIGGRFPTTKTFLFNGEQHTVKELATMFDLVPSVLHKRLARSNGDVEHSLFSAFGRNKQIDMTGQKYGRLTVVDIAWRNIHNQIEWNCVCECGGTSVVVGSQLRYGMTKSCGCLATEFRSHFGELTNKTHGMSKTPIWSIHRSMLDRCNLPTSHAYNRYGWRGIKVCDRLLSFDNFYADMGDRPEGMSLDRTDNDGPYSTENVRWATYKEQANNRRNSVRYSYGDERLTIGQWAEKAGIPVKALWERISDCVPFPLCLMNIDMRHAPC